MKHPLWWLPKLQVAGFILKNIALKDPLDPHVFTLRYLFWVKHRAPLNRLLVILVLMEQLVSNVKVDQITAQIISLRLLIGYAIRRDCVSSVTSLSVQIVTRCDDYVQFLPQSVWSLTEDADQAAFMIKIKAINDPFTILFYTCKKVLCRSSG